MTIKFASLIVSAVLFVGGAQALAGLAPAAQAEPSADTLVYSLTSPLFANTTPIGDLLVCATLTNATSVRPEISVTVSMPDSGQIISVGGPVTRRPDGELSFEFDDDAWGNSGRGSLKLMGENAQLNLEHVSSKPHATKNVLRNYGVFTLSKRPCD